MRLKNVSTVFLQSLLPSSLPLVEAFTRKALYLPTLSSVNQEGAEKTGLGPSSERYCKIYHIAVHILRSFISQLCWGGKDKIYRKA